MILTIPVPTNKTGNSTLKYAEVNIDKAIESTDRLNASLTAAEKAVACLRLEIRAMLAEICKTHNYDHKVLGSNRSTRVRKKRRRALSRKKLLLKAKQAEKSNGRHHTQKME